MTLKTFVEGTRVTWNLNRRQKEIVSHAVFGVIGELGELVNHLKKVYYTKKKKFDREYVLLELGDIFYYFTRIVEALGFTMEEIMVANNAKLRKRHAKKWKKVSEK